MVDGITVVVVVVHLDNNTIRSVNCDVVDRFGIMITVVINKCNRQTRPDIAWNWSISPSGLHVYLVSGQFCLCSIYFII